MAILTIRFGIREKLFFLILLGFGALILTTFWQIGVQARQVSSDTIGQSLEQSGIVLDTKIESRFGSIREVAKSVARDSRILPLVYESEVLTLQDQILEFKNKLDFDILFFTDGQGNVLARSDRPQAVGQNMAGKTPFFDDALAGRSGQGYFLSQGRLMQIVAEPIFDNVATDVVRGTVAIAYEFSDEMANEILSLTASDIGFFNVTRDQSRKINGVNGIYLTDNALKDSLDGYFQQSASSWQSILDQSSPVSNFQTTLNGQEYFAIARSVSNDGSAPLGFVLILRSSADLLAPFNSIQNTVLLIGVICLIVAFVLAAFVAYRISRPIVDLVSMTEGIQDGNFPDKNVAPSTSDEIGMLYRAVVGMGTNLKEKAELENYLAQMSNQISIDASQAKDTMPRIIGNDHPIDTPLVEIGRLIDNRYDVIQLIGCGAMGQVFLAQDRDLDEKTALKLLPRELFDNDAAVSIKQEIRLARRITHRNILRTFDMGNWGEHTYISMEYVAGYDLDQLQKTSGAQDVYIALLMARQICSAMIAAHEQGVIHLDLKPANMMVNRQGILKIMDFGLAQTVANQGQDKTGATELMGTPRYMAPEQFLNEKLDERTDIYSIGIILFTLLTGSPPFSHRDYMALAELQVHQELPEINGVDGLITGPLEQIIRKATEKQPNDRFQTVQEMLEQLNTL